MRKILPAWRGLTVQLLAITVLPLTLLLLFIAFGSVRLHQQDMRALVGERDERAVQAAAAALSSELHHRLTSISNLVALAELSDDTTSIRTMDDLASDFDGGLAYLDGDRRILATTLPSELWNWITENNIELASSTDSEPIFSSPFLDTGSNRLFVIISQIIPFRNVIVAGAFSPETLAR